MVIPFFQGLAGFRARASAAAEPPASVLPAPIDDGAAASAAGDPRSLVPLDKKVPGGWRGFDEQHIARLRALYGDSDIRVSQIAAIFRVSTSTLLRWIDEMGWETRRQVRKDVAAPPPLVIGIPQPAVVAQPAPVGAEPSGPEATQDKASAVRPQDLVLAVEAQVRRELELMQVRMRDTSTGAGERNARTLASLIRGLRSLQELRAAQNGRGFPAAGPEQAERPPRDLVVLRQELAERVQKIRRGSEAARMAPAGQPYIARE